MNDDDEVVYLLNLVEHWKSKFSNAHYLCEQWRKAVGEIVGSAGKAHARCHSFKEFADCFSSEVDAALSRHSLSLDPAPEKACEHEWCEHETCHWYDAETGGSIWVRCAICDMEADEYGSEKFSETKCIHCGAVKP